MKTVLSISLVVLTLAAAPIAAKAQAQECDTVLMQRTAHLLGTQARSRLAWMKLVNSDNYDQAKSQAGADVPGYFSGDYDSFSEKRNQLFSQENYASDEFEATQELRVNLPSGAVAAWRDCILAKGKGLLSWIDDIDANGATIGLAWQPAPGLGSLRSIETEIVGAKNNSGLSKLTKFHAGTKFYILQRSASNGVIKGVLSGEVKSGASYSTKFYVPPVVKHVQPVVPFTESDFERRPNTYNDANAGCDPSGGPRPVDVPIRDPGGLWNVALLKTATVTSTPTLPGYPTRHTTDRAIDGWYNNCRSWIPANPSGGTIRVDFGRPVRVSFVRIGSEHQAYFTDRSITSWKLRANGKVIAQRSSVNISNTTKINLPKSTITNSIELDISGPHPRLDEIEVYGERP